MASPPAKLNNLDYEDVKTDIKALEEALTNNDTVSLEKAKKNLTTDITKIVNSPLGPYLPSGYGNLPRESVGPLRELYSYLKHHEVSGYTQIDSVQLGGLLRAFITANDPQHPSLQLLDFSAGKAAAQTAPDEDEEQAVKDSAVRHGERS